MHLTVEKNASNTWLSSRGVHWLEIVNKDARISPPLDVSTKLPLKWTRIAKFLLSFECTTIVLPPQ